MKNIVGSMVVAATLTLASTAGACDGRSTAVQRDDAGMARFRASAMMKIHQENRAALDDSLRRQQSALLVQTRNAYLASVAGPFTAAAGAKSAP